MIPILIYFLTLTILLVNTLYGGQFLNGSDIHVEAYFAQHAISTWNTTLPYQVNSCMGVTWLTPLLAKVFKVDVVWILKVVFPLLFSFVPVILYFLFIKFIPKRYAFIAVIFFIAIPTVTMELGAITRQQLGEVFLALFFLLIFTNLKAWFKYPLMALAGAGVILSHYSLGWVLLLIYALYSLVMLFRHNWQHTVVFSVLLCMAVIYYGSVAGGISLKSFTDFFKIQNTNNEKVVSGYLNSSPIIVSSKLAPTTVSETVKTYDMTMQSALGLDFVSASSLGKAFRIVQLFTEILLILGFGYFIFRYKRLQFPFEYLVLSIISAVLLLVCVFIPGFSSILNATRWYHISLFILAPMFVLGGIIILRNVSIIGVLVLIYACFTTGMVFEAAEVNTIERPDLPYSVALSDYRMNLSGHFTQQDVIERARIANSNIKIIYADYYGSLFLQEAMYADKQLRNLPEDMKVTDGGYIFLSEYNKSSQTIAVYSGTGSRREVNIGGVN